MSKHWAISHTIAALSAVAVAFVIGFAIAVVLPFFHKLPSETDAGISFPILAPGQYETAAEFQSRKEAGEREIARIRSIVEERGPLSLFLEQVRWYLAYAAPVVLAGCILLGKPPKLAIGAAVTSWAAMLVALIGLNPLPGAVLLFCALTALVGARLVFQAKRP
jgi:hypothetical protein